MDIEQAIDEMKSVLRELPYGIDHTMRVLSYAELIMNGEGVADGVRDIVSLAAVLHDVGAMEAQRKHGSMEARYQEIEGAHVASEILGRIGVPADVAQRVCFLVRHHHTPSMIDGQDFQILWEADYLEFLLFGETAKNAAALGRKVLENFRTETGRNLAYDLLGLSE